MGGYAALAFARRHPSRLAGLLLANTRAAADTEEARKGRAETADVALREGSAAIADRMLPKLLSKAGRKKQRKLVEHVREMIESTAPEVIADLPEGAGGSHRCDGSAQRDQCANPGDLRGGRRADAV